jgi:hypothetical protein
MMRKRQYASTYYRKYREPVPKEDPTYTFYAWRNSMIESKENIGYEDWVKQKRAETSPLAFGSTASQAQP